ncbi:protein kinase containing Z-DNA binding domains [Alosa sapidissima]|uniref:protein kinase containing Z-DNA binding domains n=1 Tax=Alosa sapidissima TaxID=34773 RepID=UPI001C0A139B|nr:protein kinase containing Z-DNA binding domains [Alosa sapidissima]
MSQSTTMSSEEKILSYLKGCPAGATYSALQIAREVGLDKKDVNRLLYILKSADKLHASDDRPPKWSLLTTKKVDTPEVSKKQLPKEEQDSIIPFLKTNADGKGMTVGELSKKCNQERKSVKRLLYALHEKGEVEKLSGKLWALTVSGNEDSGDSDFAEDPNYKPEPGLSISRDFELVKKLGEGGFGYVCQVKHKMDGRFYAMKIVEYDRDAEREVRALAKCDHPNIVRYFTAWPGEYDRKDFGLHSTSEQSSFDSQTNYEDENSEFASDGHSSLKSKSRATNSRRDNKYPWLFIQMEFCEKGTLHGWIEDRNCGKSQRTRVDALQVFQQVVSGVEYIHSEGLIHRDLKPENILFVKDYTVKIGDFGLVTSVTNQNSGIMKRTVGRGTPSYMSPEQNQGRYDEKTDIFPLGLICFELLWKISTGSERVMIWPDLRNQVFPDTFCEDYSSEHKLISKMLSKTPEVRPAAAEIGKFIKDFLLSESLSQKTV